MEISAIKCDYCNKIHEENVPTTFQNSGRITIETGFDTDMTIHMYEYDYDLDKMKYRNKSISRLDFCNADCLKRFFTNVFVNDKPKPVELEDIMTREENMSDDVKKELEEKV